MYSVLKSILSILISNLNLSPSEHTKSFLEALDGGFPCRLSILRNANVTCLCHLFMPMSHVELKKYPCHMSLYFLKPCRVSNGSMSHVEFKKWPCRPVEFNPIDPNPAVNARVVLPQSGHSCQEKRTFFQKFPHVSKIEP